MEMAETTVPPGHEQGGVPDDYLIERDGRRARISVGARIVWVLRALLIVIMAAASLALFWVVGSMIGLF
jgi:hypothetical protein